MNRQELYKIFDSMGVNEIGFKIWTNPGKGSRRIKKENAKHISQVTIKASNHIDVFRKVDCFGKPFGQFYVRDLVIERIEGKAPDKYKTVKHLCGNPSCVNYYHFEIIDNFKKDSKDEK